MFYFSSGCGGGGGGAGAARFGAAPATFFIFDSVLTFYSLEASVYKFLLEGRPLWSPFLTLFNTIFNLQTLGGYGLGGFWFLPGPGSLGTSKVLMLYSYFLIFPTFSDVVWGM